MAALQIYSPDLNTQIVHTTGVDFNARPSIFKPVHVVQYDNKLPLIAVELYNNGNEYAAPTTAGANIRFRKKGGTVVYNPALGCSSDRKIIYFEITQQMAADYGDFKPVVELIINDKVANSSYITVIVDRNPIQEGDIESGDEFKSLYGYVNDAKTYADNAKASQNAAKSSQDAAKTSENNAKAYADNAKASQNAAASSATAAAGSKDAAAKSATEAANSAKAAAQSVTDATAQKDAAAKSAAAALASQNAAKTSQDEAAKSAAAAKGSENTVNASKTAAETAANNAHSSEMAASASQTAAKASQDAAAKSASDAAASQTAASGSKDAAAKSAAEAKTAETGAKDWSNWSKSYAIGEGGMRNNEASDNAKYYYDQAKRIAQGFEGSLIPMGTITFSALKTTTKQVGYMYNVSDAFTSDNTFEDGGNKQYGAGSNVYYTANNKWDVLAGTQVVSVNGETGAVVVKQMTARTAGTYAGPVVTLNNDSANSWLQVDNIKGSTVFDHYDFVISKSTGRPWMHLYYNGGEAAANIRSQQFYTTAFPQESVAKLNTARNIKIDGDVTGNANFDGSTNITINVARRGCIAGQSSNTAGSNTWYKFAELRNVVANSDYKLTLSVAHGMDLKDTAANGILIAKFRTDGSNKALANQTYLKWLECTNMTDTNFCLVYSTATPSAGVELWVNCNSAWVTYIFDVLGECTRGVHSDRKWSLVNNYNTAGAAAPTSNGYTRINSEYPKSQFASVDVYNGDITIRGNNTRAIKFVTPVRTGSPIKFYPGDVNGSGIVIGDGGRTIIGGGEAADTVRNNAGLINDSDETLHLASDGNVYLHSNCQDYNSSKDAIFNTSGVFSAPFIAGDTSDSTAKYTSGDVADGEATSWTTVAPMTSGLTHKTIFNKITLMFQNVRYLFKVIGSTSIAGIGDGTLTSAVNTLNNRAPYFVTIYNSGRFSIDAANNTTVYNYTVPVNCYLVLYVASQTYGSYSGRIDIYVNKKGESIIAGVGTFSPNAPECCLSVPVLFSCIKGDIISTYYYTDLTPGPTFRYCRIRGIIFPT